MEGAGVIEFINWAMLPISFLWSDRQAFKFQWTDQFMPIFNDQQIEYGLHRGSNKITEGWLIYDMRDTIIHRYRLSYSSSATSNFWQTAKSMDEWFYLSGLCFGGFKILDLIFVLVISGAFEDTILWKNNIVGTSFCNMTWTWTMRMNMCGHWCFLCLRPGNLSWLCCSSCLILALSLYFKDHGWNYLCWIPGRPD